MSKKFDKAFEKLKKAMYNCGQFNPTDKKPVRENERPKSRYVRCPGCNRRMRTTFRDMHPEENPQEWVEYIPKHAPKR
jgi:hypothetical protein